jgi:hypothetical protein
MGDPQVMLESADRPRGSDGTGQLIISFDLLISLPYFLIKPS